MPDLIQVPQDGIARAWPWFKDLIAVGIEHSKGRMTGEGLLAKAASGEWDCHFVYQDEDEAENKEDGPHRVQAVLFTQIYEEMSGRRVCAVRFLGGHEINNWVWLIDALELWAMKNKCCIMNIVTRRGIAKKLYEYDYRQTQSFLEKELMPFKAENHAGRQAQHSQQPAAN